MRDRIQHLQCIAQIFAAARIAVSDERSRRLALQAHARRRLSREGKRTFEVFRGQDRVAVQHERFTDCFFLRELFFSQTKCFGTVTSTTVSRNRLVECEDTRGFGGRLFRVLETALVIPSLDVVMCEFLHRTLPTFAMLLETFGDVTMQPATSNRI